jgi:hypothetical protein
MPEKRRTRSGLVCLLVLVLAACGTKPAQDGLPEGALLAGDAYALRRIVLRLERLTETPLSHEAQAVRERLEGCKQFVASTPDGDARALIASIRCDSIETLPTAARALMGKKSLVLIWPLPRSGRLAGAIDVSEDGSVSVDAKLQLAEVSGLAALVLPAGTPAGAAVLGHDDTLLHARFRPEAEIRIASFLPAGEAADAIRPLEDALFTRAVLDGTWEAAIYLPEPGSTMPSIALAVGTRARTPAARAMEALVADLRARWPVTRKDVAIGGGRGACFSDLQILPEFAPCWVATRRALVLGWNEASLAKALLSERAAWPDSASALVVRLDRFPEADERLRQVVAPGLAPVEMDYAWRQAEVRAEREGGATHIRVELRAGDGS